ncbi:cytochrome C [Massilia cellulosiltytica]|uniref:cytochrome C n=1 Tax=Massilia cellulosiltytica TaxID=2683234 RepID=UPI0039B63683
MDGRHLVRAAAAAGVLWLGASLSGAQAADVRPVAVGGHAAAQPAAITPQRARSLYLLHCAGCHQVDGSGTPAYGVPSMIDTLGVFQRTKAGRAFLVQVPGARNANVTDAELAALTNWALRTFSPKTLPADFRPYTTAEVTRWRANPPLDIAGARTQVLVGLQMTATRGRDGN